VGLSAILRNKMRSMLTTLGIMIGVGCVIVMIAVGNGASESIQANINSLGSNFIMVMPGAVTQSGARLFGGSSRLTPDDATAIASDCPSVAYASPGVRTNAQVVGGDLNWGTTVYGVDVDWPFIRAWGVQSGSFFSETDVRGATKVCLLGATVADSLFPGGDAVGQLVRIKQVPFRVIGVLERKGGSAMGQDQDDQIIAPYTTVMKQVLGNNRISLIYVSAVADDRVADAQREIEALLRQRHRLGPGQDSDFMMRSQEEIAGAAAETSRTLSMLLGSVAGISLLVGGIGIMNIMLASVTERTREIGIRRALGAKRSDITTQFLIETVLLSSIGGVLGVILGVAIPLVVSYFANIQTIVSLWSVLLAFGISMAIGVIFGLYPARRAAMMDPIEALRHSN
jgi:putative ABC transport system permease protein